MALTAFMASLSWVVGFHNARLGPFEPLTKTRLRIIGGNFQSTGGIPPRVTRLSQGEHFSRFFVQKSHYFFDKQFLLNGRRDRGGSDVSMGLQVLDRADVLDLGFCGQYSVQPPNKGPIEIIVEISNGPHEPSVRPPGAGEGEEGCFEEAGSSRWILLVAPGVSVDSCPVSLGSIDEVLLDCPARLIPWPNMDSQFGLDFPGHKCDLISLLPLQKSPAIPAKTGEFLPPIY